MTTLIELLDSIKGEDVLIEKGWETLPLEDYKKLLQTDGEALQWHVTISPNREGAGIDFWRSSATGSHGDLWLGTIRTRERA